MKKIIILLAILSIKYVTTDCPDGMLFCFDSNDNKLGQISVGRCWTWSWFSCVPCAADTSSRKISYQSYIHQCRYFHPQTIKVLDTDSVLGDLFFMFDGIVWEWSKKN